MRRREELNAAAVDEVTHPEVRVVGDGARQAFGAFVTYIQGVHDDPANADLSAMGPLVDDFMTSFTDIADIGTGMGMVRRRCDQAPEPAARPRT